MIAALSFALGLAMALVLILTITPRLPPLVIGGADITFTARHLDPSGREGWHSHDWTVTCFVSQSPWTDLRGLHVSMWEVVDVLAPDTERGREIAPENWSNEAIGRAFLRIPGVRFVHVDRPGFHARLQR